MEIKQSSIIGILLLNHPNLPPDKIPYWDYNAKDIPDTYRDVSAGSIMASALLELAQYEVDAKKKKRIYCCGKKNT